MSTAGGGAGTPLNFAVFLDFPKAEIDEALAYLFDASIELADGESAGSELRLRKDFDFANDQKSFQHLQRFLTFRHEALHMRHLAGGPLGLVHYFVAGTQYNRMAQELEGWGQRVAAESGASCRLPLLQHHANDEEMVRIEGIRTVHGMMLATVMGGLGDATLLEIASSAGGPLVDFLADRCIRVLGLPEGQTPDLLADPWDAALEPAGMNGRAVLEGLARCNEYLLAIHLGADAKTLDLLFKQKHHGVYAVALELVHQQLELPYTRATLTTAHLADLALQAPWLPFLFLGRARVSFRELLPGWRFLLLLDRCKERGIGDAHFREDPRGVGESLFDDLEWESPWRLAERVLATEFPEPKSTLTRHYVRCLQQGARLRLERPEAFVWPFQPKGSHLLEPVYYLFRDAVMPGSTGLLTAEPRYAELFLLLIDDALVDDVLMRENLSLSTIIAQRFFEASGNEPDDARKKAEACVHQQLERMVGAAAPRILAGVAAPTPTGTADAERIRTLRAQAQQQYADGDYDGAIKTQEEFLTAVERVVGREDAAALTARNNLAVMLQNAGQYTRARILQEQVLEAQVATHGEEHEASLAAMINLATSLRELGKAEEAQSLNEKVMTIGLRVLGEEDERTLTAMSHFARGLALTGRFDQAVELERRVLRVRTKIHGEEHRDTLRAMNNLAHALGQSGQSEDARALHERSLALHRRVYGDTHPETLASMANLADVLADLGDVEAAEPLHRQVYETWKAVGEDHPSTLSAMEALARTLARGRRPEDARALFATVLDHRDRDQGAQHPQTTLTAFGLYATLRAIGDSAEAASVRADYLDWVLERDPDTLEAGQRAIRDALASR